LDIWKSCDITVIVSADDAQRFSRVRERCGSRDFTDAELGNLVAHAALPYERIGCDTRVHNDHIETLARAADEIASRIG
jgi:dephospho-CoA kinase